MVGLAQHHRCIGGASQFRFGLPRSQTAFAPTSQPQAERDRPETLLSQPDLPLSPQTKTEMSHTLYWPGAHPMLVGAMPYASNAYPSSEDETSAYTQSSDPVASSHGSASWSLRPPNDSWIMTGSEDQLIFPASTSHNQVKHNYHFAEQSRLEGSIPSSWGPLPMPPLPHTHCKSSDSDVDTDFSSPSPKSNPSEFHEYGKAVYEPNFDQDSPNAAWAGSGPSSFSYLERTPSNDASLVLMGINSRLRPFNDGMLPIDLTGLPHSGLSLPAPSFEPDQEVGLERTYQKSFEVVSWSQWTGMGLQCEGANPHIEGMGPWNAAGQPFYPSPPLLPEVQKQQKNPFTYADGNNVTTLQTRTRNGGMQNVPGQPYGTNGNMAMTSGTQATVAATAQRKKEDQILLNGKRAGLTYKEIRKKMHTKVAESTLRGRYRSLTKARKDRVRKPVWTENDIRLLKEIVYVELDRLDDACYRHSTEEQRLAKLSWKRVAEYIAEHGGSYHFGNSTCKKKWAEMDAGH